MCSFATRIAMYSGFGLVVAAIAQLAEAARQGHSAGCSTLSGADVRRWPKTSQRRDSAATSRFEQALSVMAPLNPEASEDALEDAARAWSDLLQQRMRGQLMVGSSQSACGFAVGPALEEDFDSVAARFYDRQSNDESVIHVEPPRLVDLAAGPAHLLTYGRTGEEVALYFGKVASLAFNISCYGPERPEADWHSIAETIELLPAEE